MYRPEKRTHYQALADVRAKERQLYREWVKFLIEDQRAQIESHRQQKEACLVPPSSCTPGTI